MEAGILRYVGENLPRMLATLEKLVAIDSGTYDKAGVDAVGGIMARALGDLDFKVTALPQPEMGDHLVARRGSRRDGCVLVVGHMDTVFPAGTVARYPFSREGDIARGPGVLDMKGGLAGLLLALEALRETAPSVWGLAPLTIFLNSDEEVGSPTSGALIEAEARGARAALVLEPAARPGGEYLTQRKGMWHIRARVIGRAAHAGAAPEKGISAIEDLARKVVRLHALTGARDGITVNVGVIQGGTRMNVVAEEARAEIDLRARTREDGEAVLPVALQILETAGLPGTRTEVQVQNLFPPMPRTPASKALFEMARECAARIGLTVGEGSTGAGSDANRTAPLTPTLDGLGAIGDGSHSLSEHIRIRETMDRVKVLALLLARLTANNPMPPATYRQKGD
jgi:glutamate carboxypeptidase